MKRVARAQEIRDLGWPDIALPLVTGVAAPLVICHVLEYLTVGAVSIRNSRVAGLTIATLNWATLPLLAFWSWKMCRRGWQETYLAAFGVILTVMMIVSFRSNLIRSGTFDFWQSSRASWLRPIVVGALTGALIGRIWPSHTCDPPIARRSQVLPIAAMVGLWLCSLEAWREVATLSHSTWSGFAPTRHLALAFVAAVLTIVWAVSRRDMAVQ